MQTPYEILGVESDASDADIKKAYLAKVREFPPEHQGEAFRSIREAYERIATDKLRREHRLFYSERPPLAPLLAKVAERGQPRRPDAVTLMAALAECATSALSRREGQR